MKNSKSLQINSSTLSLINVNAFLFESLFVILAVALPVICHLSGAPARYLLPMHWTVILAGLVYGWRGGAVAGLLSPILSFLVSGMPIAASLFPVTVELFTYGFLTGILIEKVKLSSFASVAIALIAGRVIFLLSVIFFNQSLISQEYISIVIFPGLITALFQIISIPFIAKFWTKNK
jgi:hypothetical protein